MALSETKKPTRGQKMRAVRTRHGLSTFEFARAIGYRGKDSSLDCQIRRYELGIREIPPWINRLVLMFDAYGIPPKWRE